MAKPAETDPQDQIHHDSGSGTKWFCFNVKQAPTFMRPTRAVPPLTTKTAFVIGANLSVDKSECIPTRPLTGYEHFGVMGYPVCLPASHPLTKLLPANLAFAHTLRHQEALSNTQLMQLSGNAMHLHQMVVVWLLIVGFIGPLEQMSIEPPTKRRRIPFQ
eukprot:6123055-Amphidinium_carterae.1